VNGQPAVRLQHLGEFFASSPLPFLWESLPDVWRDAFLTRDIFPLNARAKGVKTTPKTMKERHLQHDRLKSWAKEHGLLGFDSLGNPQGQGEDSLTDEQREAVARYLTTAPEIPRIVSRIQNTFGAPSEVPLPPNWGPDDLVRWICRNTDAATGKGHLTQEGYLRACELYPITDEMIAIAEDLRHKGKTEVLSLAEHLQSGGQGLPPVATEKKPRENASHGALCEMQPKTITVFRDGGRRFISKADMELIHAWMLETSHHAKLPPLPRGVAFAGERKKERNPHYLVEKWIRAECPKEANWGGERGTVSLRELGEFYARHEELLLMLPVALRDYLREELGLRGHRESGIQDNGYGPDGAAEWVSRLNDTWPEPEDGWKPVFTAEIIEAGRGPWKPAVPVVDAPKPIQGRKRAIDGGKVKDWEFKQQVKPYFDKGLGDAEIARILNTEQEDFALDIITPSKVRAARRWWGNNAGYIEKPRVQNAPKKRGGKKG